MTNHFNNEKTEKQKQDEMDDMMRQLTVSPTEACREKSYQAALAGIETARKQSGRSRWTKKLKEVGTPSALTAVAVLLMVYFVSSETLFESSKSTNDQALPVEESALAPTEDADMKTFDTSSGKMVEERQGIEVNQLLALERPKSKEMTVYPEGMEETVVYRLVTVDPAFTTYIPEDWGAELLIKNSVRKIKLAPGEFDYGAVEIVFLPSDYSEEQAREYVFEQALDGSQDQYQVLEAEARPAWSLDSYFANLTEISAIREVIFAEHQGQYFYVVNEYKHEAGDGWAVIEPLIFEGWIWTDTGKPLQTNTD